MSYTVQPGDSWASIAGKVYGNQRWYEQLAAANAGVGMLTPGMTISTPNFDTDQDPLVQYDPESLNDLANDPDSDRLAVAEKQQSDGTWKIFNGNEIGAMLAENKELREEVTNLREMLDKRWGFESIIGNSPVMERLFDQMRLVAPTRSNVLVIGESGTGKELVAHAIHFYGPRGR